MIYLDESGVSTQMTRLYGRCRGGRRVTDAVPGGDWKIITILGAMNLQGMLAAMTIEAATDREVFLAFLDEVLCPKLKPGDVLIMDNLSAHKVDGVRQRIEAGSGQSGCHVTSPVQPVASGIVSATNMSAGRLPDGVDTEQLHGLSDAGRHHSVDQFVCWRD
ncbi:MAG: transposase [Edaphobacter sp.]